jgi:hypothetical protein
MGQRLVHAFLKFVEEFLFHDSFFPVWFGHRLGHGFQCFLLIRAQVVRLTFVENENHVNRLFDRHEVVNNSRAAAFALTPRGHADFPQTARSLNDLALRRIFDQFGLERLA